MSTKTTNTVIAAGLRADIMRKRMETKNTLTTKGDIYVGLGLYDSDTNYQTGALSVGTNNYVLMCDSTSSLGLKYGLVDTASLKDGAVTAAKLNSAGFSASYITSDQFDQDRIPSLDCNKITTGTLDLARLPTIPNRQLQNSSIILGSTSMSLGDTITTVAGLTSISSTTFVTTSDERLKENIKEFNYRKSILDLPIKSFDFINGEKNQIGCLAQDLQKLYPELVETDSNGYLSIKETKLIYLLIKEVAQLKQQLQK